MKLLFAASEAAPFAKSGGLGDVAGSLPAELARQGCDVHVVLPLYEKIGPQWRERMTFLKHFEVPLSWRRAYCGVFQLELEGVTYWFLDNEYYFKRADLYGYYDDGERFAYFSRAILELPGQLGWSPDVIHCNDWQTALVPVYLLQCRESVPGLGGVKTVFTIHNIEYQGRFGPDILEDTFGLSRRYFHDRLLAYYGDVNLMKGAIYASDFVTTVSPTYAKQLRYAFYAHGLEGVIADNAYKMRGILNGIDLTRYDPETDLGLTTNYSAKDLSGKAECKAALQKLTGLNPAPETPVLACVSRLVPHKGFDLVLAVLQELMGLGIQFVVLGTGDWKYQEVFRRLEGQYPGRAAARLFYSAELSDAIYAGADLFLMPSVSEPCGLSQIIAMRYGTLPIVRETGGLKDTVAPYNRVENTGTGFTFSSINAHDMLWVVREAVELYHTEPEAWQGLVERAMAQRYDWRRSAGAYIEIYQQITE
ncbi:MAG: glycogen synthase GlgA [Oscillospiraceae bacterium]|nr:glycogen synthase GlgA [Oscillospiraceae bacterium]